MCPGKASNLNPLPAGFLPAFPDVTLARVIDPWLFAESVFAGIAVAAPVGPMSLLCMQQTLRHGRAPGLVFGAGIAAADLTYAAIGAFGLTAIARIPLASGPELRIAAAVVLLYFAWRIWRSDPVNPPSRSLARTAWQGFSKAYVLTLANPPTIVFFTGLFASLAPLSSTAEAAVFSLGVLAGSLFWWMALTAAVAATASKLSPPALAWINRGTGLAVAGLAVYTLARG
jgi:threonine/homoserine/homoserine lactone efflux protein